MPLDNAFDFYLVSRMTLTVFSIIEFGRITPKNLPGLKWV